MSYLSPHHIRSLQLFPSPLPKNPGSLNDNNKFFFTLSVFVQTGVSVQEYVNWGKMSAKAKEGAESPELGSQELWVVHRSCQAPNSSLWRSSEYSLPLSHLAISQSWVLYWDLGHVLHPCRSVWLMPWALTLLHYVFRDELAQNPNPCSQFRTEGIFKKLLTAQYVNYLN